MLTGLVAVPQTKSSVRRGRNGVGGGYQKPPRESQYTTVHIYVYEISQHMISKYYSITWSKIKGE